MEFNLNSLETYLSNWLDDSRSLPPSIQKIGSTDVEWWLEPNGFNLIAKNGTPADKAYAEKFISSELEKYLSRATHPIEPIEKTSTWEEVASKAKRLVQQGKVHLHRNGYNIIVSTVEGDHGTYEVEISREDPDSRSITQWSCPCSWGEVSFGRCLIQGTNITLPDGSDRPIEDIVIGDSILDHTGQIGKVIDTHKEWYEKDIIKIKTSGYSLLEIKPTHPILIVKRDETVSLNENKSLFILKDKSSSKFIQADKIQQGDFLVRPNIKKYGYYKLVEVNEVKKSPYKGWLYDLSMDKNPGFLAEGFAVHNTRKWKKYEGRVCVLPETLISLYNGGIEFIEDIKVGDNVMSHKGNGKVTEVIKSHYSGRIFSIYSAKYKNGPPYGPLRITENHEVWTLKIPLVKDDLPEFPEHYVYSDTFLSKEPKWVDSQDLKINDFVVSRLGTWEGENLNNDVGWRRYRFAKILDIKESYYEGPVYNLRVDDQESYNAEFIVVHNCSHALATYWQSLATPLDEDIEPNSQNPNPSPFGPKVGQPGELQNVPQGQGPRTFSPEPAAGQAEEPNELIPPFPYNPENQPQVNPASVPGQRQPSPLNPMQMPSTFSNINKESDYPLSPDGRSYPDHLRPFEDFDKDLLPLVSKLQPVNYDHLSDNIQNIRQRAGLSRWLSSARWRGLIDCEKPNDGLPVYSIVKNKESSIRQSDTFANGDMVQLKEEEIGTWVGLNGGGQVTIPMNSIGEVLSEDPTHSLVLVYFAGPAADNGPLEPHGANCWLWKSQLIKRPGILPGGPAVNRR